jgi:hypothetical protein
MHMFVIACAALSTICAVYVGVPYMRTIIRGETKPHQYTWFIFMIMDGIIVVSQYLAGGRLSVLAYFVYFIYSAIIFGLSLKYGVRNSSSYDRLLLGLALATIVLWALTRNNALAIWLTVLIDSYATTMLILKVRARPSSEPLYLWCIGSAALLFSSLTLLNKPVGILYVRPWYGFFSDVALVIAIIAYQPKRKKSQKEIASFPEPK